MHLMQEIVFHKGVRLYKCNLKFPNNVLQGQILFLIRSRLVCSPAESNIGFSAPISYNFSFNLDRLSSTDNVKRLVMEAMLSTHQFHEQRNILALANSISEFLVNNYSLGLDTSLSNPNAPKVLIVVEVCKTRAFRGFQDYGGEEVEIRDQFNGEEDTMLRLRYLLKLPVLSVLEPSDLSEPLGLMQVPGIDSFQLCDSGTLGADQGTCAICLEGFFGESYRKMPCSHVFHGECIARWIWRKNSCPMCRYHFS